MDHFSLPSFEGDGRCNPGYPANPEHVCFNSSTVTFLDTRQGDTVGTVELEQDGVNLFVAAGRLRRRPRLFQVSRLAICMGGGRAERDPFRRGVSIFGTDYR